MFIEKSKYLSTIRVRIMDKELTDGVWKKKLIRHVGTARSDLDLAVLMQKAQEMLFQLERPGQFNLEFGDMGNRSGLRVTGEYHEAAELVLGHFFDRLQIKGPNLPLLRLLVISRILLPQSKMRTARFIKRSFGTSVELDQIYRFMDTLAKGQDGVLASIRSHLTQAYPGSFELLLYDVTTLYFETDSEDEDMGDQPGFRKRGYSKDMREDLPQIVLGLAVNSLGMPVTYRLYPGNTYEGSTLVDGIDETLRALGQRSLTVVGDAGMLSEKNLSALEERGLFYIVGARLKSLPKPLQDEITSLDFTRANIEEVFHKKRRIIISYSETRAKRATSQRERSVARLEGLIRKNQAIRKHQYLDFTIREKPSIDFDAVAAASRWDGIKGYVTNNPELSPEDVISHYGELYKVEQSFRMSKTDLRIRPAFHYRQRRIEAHVVICMLALCVMRMLECHVKPLGMTLKAALEEINSTKAAYARLGKQH
ncbi:MAG: IS1634 family transposase, partial [Actinomycetota bacterium]